MIYYPRKNKNTVCDKERKMYNDGLRLSKEGGRLVAALECEIDHHTAGELRSRIDREIFVSKPSLLEMDFRAVKFMDSSGLSLIVGRVETMSAIGGAVVISNMGGNLKKLLRLSGIDRLRGLTVEGEV